MRISRFLLTSVVIASILGFVGFSLLANLPKLQEGDIAILKRFPPKTLSDLISQRDVLLAYARQHPVFVFCSFCILYVSMQTFAIPGTLSLSLLSGALYGNYRGLLLVTVISTLGSTCCYLLSKSIGSGIAQAIWPAKVEAYRKEVEKRKNDILSYIIFLRLTPILPNTFINVASPVVRVPLLPFISGTLLGCIPNNFIAVKTGSKLGELSSLADLYDVRQVCLGLALGVAALLPILLRRQQSAAGLSVESEEPL